MTLQLWHRALLARGAMPWWVARALLESGVRCTRAERTRLWHVAQGRGAVAL